MGKGHAAVSKARHVITSKLTLTVSRTYDSYCSNSACQSVTPEAQKTQDATQQDHLFVFLLDVAQPIATRFILWSGKVCRGYNQGRVVYAVYHRYRFDNSLHSTLQTIFSACDKYLFQARFELYNWWCCFGFTQTKHKRFPLKANQAGNEPRESA
jgi:hypothetical protein